MLSQITARLSDANSQISKLESSLAERPDDSSLQMMMSSVKKLRDQLEEEFTVATSRAGLDICNYRLFGEGVSVAANLFEALVRFQSLFTLIFASIESKAPRKTRAVGKEFATASAFGFSHSYIGSAGFVLTMPNERLLVGETSLDESISELFRMAHFDSPQSVREISSRFGLGVIRELYQWSKAHTTSSIGADIDWRRRDKVKASIFIQPQEFQELERIIDSTSDEIVEAFEWEGYLRGADADTKTFRFETDDGQIIRGSFVDAIDDKHEVTIPHHRYAVIVKKTTIVHYSIDQEDIRYFLEAIKPL